MPSDVPASEPTSSVSLSSRIRPASDVLFRDIDGEAVLGKIVAEYEVEEERAQADLLRLVGELIEHGLATVEATSPE